MLHQEDSPSLADATRSASFDTIRRHQIRSALPAWRNWRQQFRHLMPGSTSAPNTVLSITF